MIPDLAMVVTEEPCSGRTAEGYVRQGMRKVLPCLYKEIRWNTVIPPDRRCDLWFLYPKDHHDALRMTERYFASKLIRKRVAMMDRSAPCFDVCFVSWEKVGPPGQTVGDDERNYLCPSVIPALDPEWIRSRSRDYVFWQSSDHWEEWHKSRMLDEVLVPRLCERGISKIILAHWDRAGMIPIPMGMDVELLPTTRTLSEQRYRLLIAGAALFVMSSRTRPHSVKLATGLGVPAILPYGYSQQLDTLLPDSNLSILDDREGYVRRHKDAVRLSGVGAIVERIRGILE